jgi:hypothetical protein
MCASSLYGNREISRLANSYVTCAALARVGKVRSRSRLCTTVRSHITTKRVNFIFDADVRSFIDSVSQSHPVRFLEHRIGPKRIIRLIR